MPSLPEYAELVNKPVRVELVSGGAGPAKVDGNLYTVDPVTGDLVIMRFQDNEPSVMSWFPRAAVRRVTALEEVSPACRPPSVELDEFFNTLFHNEQKLDEVDVSKRREEVINWLRRNHVEVKSTPPVLLIFGCVRVEPPFRPDDCHCDNPIVLKRVRAMIEKCPSQ